MASPRSGQRRKFDWQDRLHLFSFWLAGLTKRKVCLGHLGSGFQDVDISRRITKQANIVRRDAKQGAASLPIPADVADGIDDALPNHASNDWSLNCHAKVLNSVKHPQG